jgi:hypothetical protein
MLQKENLMKNIFDYNMQIWVAMNDRLNESVDNEDVNEGLQDVNPMDHTANPMKAIRDFYKNPEKERRTEAYINQAQSENKYYCIGFQEQDRIGKCFLKSFYDVDDASEYGQNIINTNSELVSVEVCAPNGDIIETFNRTLNEGWDNENPDDWDDFDLTPEEQIEKAIKNREFYVISYEDPSHKEWEFCGSYKSRENAINTADACVGASGTYAVVYDCNKKMVYDAISDKAGDEYEFDDED